MKFYHFTKKSFLLLTILPFINFQISFCQSNLDTLYFPNKAEYLHFKNYFDSKNSLISLATSIQGNDKVNQQKVNDFNQNLVLIKNNTKNMSDKNRLKYIFNYVQTKYLKQYKDVANINEIFESGTFNCVSASLIYASIFNSLGIPFQLKETPTHVYIIAYPKSLNIIVESTNAKGLILEYDAKNKQIIVNDLVEKKLVSIDSLNAFGVEKTFEKFMFSDKNIDTTQAIGDLYYNECVKQSEVKNYVAALNSMYKAYKLHPNDKNKYILLTAYEQVISSSMNNSDKDFFYLTDYVNLLNNESSFQYLLQKYSNFLIKNIQQKSNPDACVSLFNVLKNRLYEKSQISSLTQFHSIELTKYYFRKNDYLKSLKICSEGLKVNLENNEIEYFFNEIINSKLRNIENNKSITTDLDSIYFELIELQKTSKEIFDVKSIKENSGKFELFYLLLQLYNLDENNSNNFTDKVLNDKLLELENKLISLKAKTANSEFFEGKYQMFYERAVGIFYKHGKTYTYARIWNSKGKKLFPKEHFFVQMENTFNYNSKKKTPSAKKPKK